MVWLYVAELEARMPAMTRLEALVGSMTLGELARLAGRSLDEVVAVAMNGTRPTPASGVPPKRDEVRPRGELPRGGVRVDRVLAAVVASGKPIDINSIRAKVGGSTAQVRAALRKLADAGKLGITGQRRGTRYAVR